MSWIIDQSANRLKKSYLNGFLDISGSPVSIRSSSRLDCSANAFMGNVNLNYLTINNDVSLNKRLFIGGDVSLNSNVYIKGNLTATYPINSIPSSAIIGGISSSGIFTTDISCNGRLFLSNDVSFNKRLFVGNDASFNGNVYIKGNLTATYANNSIPSSAIIGSGYTGTSGVFSGDLTSGGKLLLTGDASLNGKVFVNGDISCNGRLFVGNGINNFIEKGVNWDISSPPVNQGQQKYWSWLSYNWTAGGNLTIVEINSSFASSFPYILLGNNNCPSVTTFITLKPNMLLTLNFYATTSSSVNVSININNINYYSIPITAGSWNVYSCNFISVNGSNSINFNETGIKMAISQLSLSNSINNMDLNIYGNTFLNGMITTNFLSVNYDCSLNSRLILGGDSTLNGNVLIKGNLTANYTNSSIPSTAIIGGVPTGSFSGDITGSNRLFITNDASLNGKLYVGGGSNIVIQGGQDGGAGRGIRLWTSADTNWGIYMGQSGATKSLAGATAVAGYDFVGYAVRLRVGNVTNQGFIIESMAEELIASVHGTSGNTYIKGGLTLNSNLTASSGNLTIAGNCNLNNNLTVTGVLTANSGSKLVIQNSQDGGVGRGIYLWNASESGWAIYMGQSGATKSILGGTAVAGYDFSSYAVRFRTGNGAGNGFIFESLTEVLLASINGSTGNTYIKGGLTIGGSSTITGSLTVGGNETITGNLTVTGNTIINTNLSINGYYLAASMAFTYFDYGKTVFTNATTTQNVGLYSRYSVWTAAAFVASSDERIKTNIIDVDDISALETLRKIQPKRYNYKDTVKRGNKPVWGFIAQQVKSVLDYSVSEQTEVIPNIYDMADISGDIITLNNVSTSLFTFYDASGNSYCNIDGNLNVRLIDENEKEIVVGLTEIVDDKTFKIKEELEITKCFVYGQEVNDFHTVDKNAIFTIATAALQEVDRELQAAKIKIDTQQQQIDGQQQIINDLINRITALENK